MYLTHPLMVINLSAKFDKPISKLTEVTGHEVHEDMTKAFKVDLGVKGQGRIWIMNVRDTSSHGDTPMCQIW